MTPAEALESYCAAFAARDAERVTALFGANGLYEMPLLRSRMVGKAEIRAGLERAFAAMAACAIETTRVQGAGATAIGEGTMTATLANGPARIPFAIVAVVDRGLLRRLTVHLDARPFRPWSDGPVMAVEP